MPCRCERGSDERGAVTVEFAVALPVLAVVVSLGIGGVVLVDGQGRLQSAAATAARAYGRDDDAAARAALAGIAPGATSSVTRSDELVCVVAERRSGPGPLAAITLRGASCAATGGR